MLDPTEVGFLRSMAEEPDDTTAALVYADWLEERGDAPRAEFLRVQCVLASAGLARDRRSTLRVRERELLIAHRREWCQAFGVLLEDVSFARGVIAKARLAEWEGVLYDPASAARFATLTELDLSGLGLGDEEFLAFAERAQLPALRKLILSDNGLTDAGAAALANATGLPRLDTVYLFHNPIGAGARAALERSPHFKLTNLDVGERADGYCMSPGEAEVARRRYIRTELLPLVTRYFTDYERLQSALLSVAQYRDDEADDAVHASLIVSELFEPTLVGVSYGFDQSDVDANLPTTRIVPKNREGPSSRIRLWDTNVTWDDNNGAIPLWAAFSPEGGSQEYGELSEAYAPAVLFYRHGGYEVLPMLRPHLDGVRPEWGGED